MQIAEDAYKDLTGECEDLKTKEDEKFVKELEKELDNFLEKHDLTDESIKNLIDGIKEQAKQKGSDYFKTAYPDIFT